MNARRRAAMPLLFLAALLILSSAGATADDCYENVRVRGGADVINGTYRFQRMIDGRPGFQCSSNPSVIVYFQGEWHMYYDQELQYDTVWYSNSSQSMTPPTSGWTCDDCDLPPCPTPRVSGGEPCSGQGEPVVEITLAKTLDLPEGEAPPMIGSLPLSAVFCLGEEIAVDLVVVEEDGDPIENAQVHAVLYSVEIGEDEEVRTEILEAAVRPDRRTGECHVAFASEELPAAIYDLKLRVNPRILDPTYFRIRLDLCTDGASGTPACYEDIVVSGAGESDANGSYEFLGPNALTGRPSWGFYASSGEGVNRYSVTRHIYFDAEHEAWVIYVLTQSFGRRFAGYINYSTAGTPPRTGWEPHPEEGYSSRLPLPTLTGGEPCTDLPDG
ncbi:MAG: hypothetical protein JSW65_07255 [Candidatus Bipolaricaulota bacterium]|nr:MAG: hypothetical protein JSW65_07255 [Candidatus Bipolaricaulota bacterium]